MIRALIAILLVGGLSVHYSDFSHESALFSVLLPLLALVSLIALALWLVAWFHRKGIRQKTRAEPGSGIDFPGDGPGGADGG